MKVLSLREEGAILGLGGLLAGDSAICSRLSALILRLRPVGLRFGWETGFYTPLVLGGAAPFDNSAAAVYKIQGPWDTGSLYTTGAEL